MKDVNYEFKLQPLFPSLVSKFNINRNLTKKELSVINSQQKYQNAGNTTSLDTYIFKNFKELKKINDFVFSCVKIHFDKIIQPKDEVEIYLTQSWCNYTEPGQYHHKHSHPNSLLSGVFYVQADAEKDKIIFHKNDNYEQIKLEPKEYNPFNSSNWWLPVKTGDLFLFNSSLQHSVEKTTSDKTRISISFNTFVKGNIGSERNLTQLILK